jgi:hypothetical protein
VAPTTATDRACQLLPDGIDSNRAVDALDKALKDSDPAFRAAVAVRFGRLFPDTLKNWRASKKAATRRRVDAIDKLLARGGEGDS